MVIGSYAELAVLFCSASSQRETLAFQLNIYGRARGRCLWVDSSCYPIWESLIAAAIQFGNKFPQSASLAQIKKSVPTPISASTFVLLTVLIHLQSYFCKFSL